MAERYVTVAEAADQLSVSHDTILRLIHAGTLPALRVSERLFRIPRPAFERFVSGEPVLRRRVVHRRARTGVMFGSRDRQATPTNVS